MSFYLSKKFIKSAKQPNILQRADYALITFLFSKYGFMGLGFFGIIQTFSIKYLDLYKFTNSIVPINSSYGIKWKKRQYHQRLIHKSLPAEDEVEAMASEDRTQKRTYPNLTFRCGIVGFVFTSNHGR